MTFGQSQPQPVQDILDELDAALDDLDFAPPPTPASAAAAAAAFRRSEAERKRRERARRRDSGLPDTRAVDAAIVQALVDVLRDVDARGHMQRHRELVGLSVPASDILGVAMRALLDRGLDRHVAGRILQGKLFPVNRA